MAKSLTSSDRSSLIKLASQLPKGSDERRAILSGLGKVSAPEDAPLPLGNSILRRMEGGSVAVVRGIGEIMSLVGGEDLLLGPPGSFKGIPKFKPGRLKWVSRGDTRKVMLTLKALGAETYGNRGLWVRGIYVIFIPVQKGAESPGYGSDYTFPNDVLIANYPDKKTMFFLDKLVGRGWSGR
jgi:hypothetical protein